MIYFTTMAKTLQFAFRATLEPRAARRGRFLHKREMLGEPWAPQGRLEPPCTPIAQREGRGVFFTRRQKKGFGPTSGGSRGAHGDRGALGGGGVSPLGPGGPPYRVWWSGAGSAGSNTSTARGPSKGCRKVQDLFLLSMYPGYILVE